MANKILVQFEAKGAQALKSAIDQLAVAQTRLTKGTKKAELLQKKLNKELLKYGGKAAPLAIRNSRLLSNSFATMRSTLLLASFGFGLVAGSIGKLLKLFGEQEKAILKLNNALGFNSTLLQEQAAALQNITGVGDEVIIQSQSILASFVRNEEAVSNLTIASLDLSAALGIDLNSSANLLGKTIGSTTNSLSRYGVSVTGAANSTERIESVIKNVNILFGNTAAIAGSSTAGALSKLSASLGDLLEKLGELLVSVGFITAIDVLTFSFKSLGLAVNEALSFIGINNEQLQKGIGVSKDIVKIHNEEVQSIKSLNNINDVRAKISTLEIEKQRQIEIGLRNVSKVMKDTTESSSRLSLLTGDVTYNMGVMLPVSDELSDHLTTNKQAGEGVAVALEKTAVASKTLALTDKELIIAQAKLQELMATGLQQLFKEEVAINNLNVLRGEANLFDVDAANIMLEKNLAIDRYLEGLDNEIVLRTKLLELDAKEIDLTNQLTAAKLESAAIIVDSAQMITGALSSNLDRQANAEIAKKKKTGAWERADATKREQMEKDIQDKYFQRRKNLFMVEKALAISDIYIKTAVATMGTHAQMPGLLGLSLATWMKAQGAINAAIVMAQPMPSYEYGGMVGGNRHAQGGTVIEAERGEFVMSRDAVDSIGINNLEAMNQGGGGVTVNISGNVMTDEFVEEVLAEKIASAVRRGTDFGIS